MSSISEGSKIRNALKVVILLAILTLFVMSCGYALGGADGAKVAFFFACFISLGLYGFSGRITLSMHRAQPLAEEEAPEVFNILKKLSEKAGILMPKLYVLPSASANAFAVGRSPKHAAIAITHGLVGLLNKEELSGVLGHELSHILDRNSLLSSIVAALAGVGITIASVFCWSFSWGGERDERDRGHPLGLVILSILMPLLALFIRAAISRSGEYRADRMGAGFCEEPLYLASAIRKIDVAAQRFPMRDACPATSHLFIMNPLSGKGWTVLFSTHPAPEDRIARLEAMGRLKCGA